MLKSVVFFLSCKIFFKIFICMQTVFRCLLFFFLFFVFLLSSSNYTLRKEKESLFLLITIKSNTFLNEFNMFAKKKWLKVDFSKICFKVLIIELHHIKMIFNQNILRFNVVCHLYFYQNFSFSSNYNFPWCYLASVMIMYKFNYFKDLTKPNTWEIDISYEGEERTNYSNHW